MANKKDSKKRKNKAKSVEGTVVVEVIPVGSANPKVGRPTDYSFELAQEICNKIASSSDGLKKLCKKHESWPHPDTIYMWLMKHKEFADLYAQAKKNQIEVLIDEIVEISDDSSNDETFDRYGEVVPNHEFINRSRVRIDTRKWLASKLIPRVYGDRVTQEHTGKDGDPIKVSHHDEFDLSALSIDELKQFRELRAKAAKKSNETK